MSSSGEDEEIVYSGDRDGRARGRSSSRGKGRSRGGSGPRRGGKSHRGSTRRSQNSTDKAEEASQKSSDVGAKEDADAKRPDAPRRRRGGSKSGTGRNGKKRKGNASASDPNESPSMIASLTQSLTKGEYECMVCMDRIGRKAQIWSCRTCFHSFHAQCVKKWAQKAAMAKGWRCPGCQTEYDHAPRPSCFCGQMRDPEYNPYITPHSCGELCGRLRGPSDELNTNNCPHPCNLVCHPGPCPPCSSLGPMRKCQCGKTSYRLRCGESDKGGRTCGQQCERLLNCGVHRCQRECHSGECDECNVMVEQSCYCGRHTEKRVCGSGAPDPQPGRKGSYSCAKMCNKKLSCGNHSCTLPCHPGACPLCSLSPDVVSTCPCGKKPLHMWGEAGRRKKCTDPILTCWGVCGKLLACRVHSCPRTCHEGECGECQQSVEMLCRCGSKSQEILCKEAEERGDTEFVCEKRCNTLRNCRRHRCNTVCCPQGKLKGDVAIQAHACPLQCNKVLPCKKHTCQEPCHRGKCPPCVEGMSFDDLSCHCGKTVLRAPIHCGTPPPKCHHPCVRPRACDHTIEHPCHSEPSCPPCPVGGHDVRNNVPCHVKDVSCGRVCGRPMRCGLHRCQRYCHRPPCTQKQSKAEQVEGAQDSNEQNGDDVGNNKDSDSEDCGDSVGGDDVPKSCGQPCNAELFGCSHRCKAPCHPGAPCPAQECREITLVKCDCGRRTKKMLCFQVKTTHVSTSIDDRPMMLKKREANAIECNEECFLHERNKRLADAFGIPLGPDGSASRSTSYPDSLIAMAATTPRFIKRVEDAFATLLGDASRRTHPFPPLNKYHRKILSDLLPFYGLTAELFDSEPNRSVVISKTAKSCKPAVLLSEYCSRAPFRRVPSTGGGALTEPPAAMIIYDIPARYNNLSDLLKAFEGEYSVEWIDSESCAVLFNKQQHMEQALRLCSAYRLRPCRDVDSHFSASGQPPRSFGATTKQSRVRTPFSVPDTQAWNSKNNFSALSGNALDKAFLAKGAPQDLAWAAKEKKTKQEAENNLSLEVPEVSSAPTEGKEEKEEKAATVMLCDSVDDWEALVTSTNADE